MKFSVMYHNKDLQNFEKLGVFFTIEQAKEAVRKHPNFKSTFFTKKGIASSKNPDSREYFRIVDSDGGMWYIK
jgi:hypothetical protein